MSSTLGSTSAAADAATDTLVIINGEAITAADMDAMILEAHGSGGMVDMTAGRLYRLYQKAINDRLIGLQREQEIGRASCRERV